MCDKSILNTWINKKAVSVLWCLPGHLARQRWFCLVVLKIDKQTASCHSLSLTFSKYPLLPPALHLFHLSFSISALNHRFSLSSSSPHALYRGLTAPRTYMLSLFSLCYNELFTDFRLFFPRDIYFVDFKSVEISLVLFLSLGSKYIGHVVFGRSISVTYLRDRSSLSPACGLPNKTKLLFSGGRTAFVSRVAIVTNRVASFVLFSGSWHYWLVHPLSLAFPLSSSSRMECEHRSLAHPSGVS